MSKTIITGSDLSSVLEKLPLDAQVFVFNEDLNEWVTNFNVEIIGNEVFLGVHHVN